MNDIIIIIIMFTAPAEYYVLDTWMYVGRISKVYFEIIKNAIAVSQYCICSKLARHK